MLTESRSNHEDGVRHFCAIAGKAKIDNRAADTCGLLRIDHTTWGLFTHLLTDWLSEPGLVKFWHPFRSWFTNHTTDTPQRVLNAGFAMQLQRDSFRIFACSSAVCHLFKKITFLAIINSKFSLKYFGELTVVRQSSKARVV